MTKKIEAGSNKAERLPSAETSNGGPTPSLRVYNQTREELIDLARAAEKQFEDRDKILGAPDENFNRTIVDRHNAELQEIAGKMKGLLEDMHEYRFNPPSKWNEKQQADLEKTIEKSTSILDRIETNSEEKARSIRASVEGRLRNDLEEAMEESKESRVELTTRIKRAKTSFAGKYKVSYDRALVLSKAPTSWLGRLADRLAGNTPLTTKEIQLAKRLQTTEAKEDMEHLGAFLEKAGELWAKIHKADKGTITSPSSLVSEQTLRTVTKEMYPDLSEDEKERKADKAVMDFTAMDNYEDEIANAELTGEVLSDKDREAMLPPQPKEDKELEDALNRLKNEKSPEQETIEKTVEAFGGGEKGRKAAADLWDEIQDKINGITKDGEKLDFTALEFVKLAGELKVAAANPESSMEYDSILKDLQRMGKELGYTKANNPAILESGKSRLGKAKYLGANVARGVTVGVEKETRIPPMGQSMSVEWAANVLSPEVAKKEWDQTLELMRGHDNDPKHLELASYMVHDAFRGLQNKLWIIKKGLSPEFAKLVEYNEKPQGTPPEATLLVMLGAYDKLQAVGESDERAKQEIKLTLDMVRRQLNQLNQPIQETPGKEKPKTKKKTSTLRLVKTPQVDQEATTLRRATKNDIELPRFEDESQALELPRFKDEAKELPRFQDADLAPTEDEAPTLRKTNSKEAKELVQEAMNLLPEDLVEGSVEAFKNYKKAIHGFYTAKNEEDSEKALATLRELNKKYKLNKKDAKSLERKVFESRDTLIIG